MNKFLHYLLLSLPLILCSENYVEENVKHQALFLISPVGQADRNANFLSLAFPEIYQKITSRHVVSPSQMPSIKGNIEVTILLGTSSASKKNMFDLSGMGSNVKHITIIGGDDLSFLEKHRVTSLTLLNFRGNNINVLFGMPIEKLIIRYSPNLDDKIVPCLKSFPLKHLEIHQSGKITDYSFLKRLKLHTLKIHAGDSFNMEFLPEKGLEVFHLTATPTIKFTGQEEQLKSLKELVLTNVSIDAAVYPLFHHSLIENLALQQIYVTSGDELFEAISRLSHLKNFFCINIFDVQGRPHNLPWNKLATMSLESLVCDCLDVESLSKYSALRYLKIVNMRRDYDKLPDTKTLSKLQKLNLISLILCRFPPNCTETNLKFPFRTVFTNGFSFFVAPMN